MPEILLYGIIGDPWDGLDAISLVPAISQSEGTLDVRINSPGGYVMEGLAIYNALQREISKGRTVNTYVDGLAASMGSVIAMAGSQIIMAENSLMMIHNPWDCACGDAAELRAAADKLDLLRDQLVSIYAKQTGLTPEELIPLLDAETWLTAQDALAQKFITSIAPSISVEASNVKPFGFRKAPDSPLITTMAMSRRQAAPAAPQCPQENVMDLYLTRAALVAAIDKFQKEGGTQGEIDKIAKSAVALNAQDALPATGALAATPAPATPAAPVAAVPPAAAPVGLTQADVDTAVAAASERAVAAERTRVTEIRALGAKHNLDQAFIDSLVTSGTPLAAARDKMLDKLAEASDAANIGHSRVEFGTDAKQKWLDGAAAWLMTRAGVAPIVARAAKMKGETINLDPGEFRGVSCVELARESLINAGARISARDPNRIVGDAMTARNAITQTTGDFTVLLENVMHKTLQAAYATTPDTWSRFCGVGSVIDFRVANRYLRGTFGALESLNEAGEFKNKVIPDGAKQTIQAATKGNIIALTRQALINDDMGVFSDLAVELGRAAKLTVEVDVYALLKSNPVMADGVHLFDAAHSNIAAQAAAPGVAAFDAARVAMAQQMDVSGNEFLDIRPDSWLGPLSMGGTVRVIIGSPYDPDTANKLQRPNMVQGLVKDVIDTPRLGGTAWYMFADKEIAPAIEVAFLNGIQEPFLDNELGWRVDGTEFKVRLDYGVGAVNYRSAYMNPGA